MKKSEIAQILELLDENNCWSYSIDEFDYLIGLSPSTGKSLSKKDREYVFIRSYQKEQELIKAFTKVEEVIDDIYCDPFDDTVSGAPGEIKRLPQVHVTADVPIPAPP